MMECWEFPIHHSNTSTLQHSKHSVVRKFSILALILCALFSASLHAQTPFYQGKTIRIVVSNLPGRHS
jgi:hypothetical protein